MKVFYQILLVTVIVSIKLTAQDIENEILNYSDTDIQIINKSRKLILDKLYEKDLEKVKEALNYLDEKFDTSKVITLWETEEDMLETEHNRFFQEQIIKFMDLFKELPVREDYEVVVKD